MLKAEHLARARWSSRHEPAVVETTAKPLRLRGRDLRESKRTLSLVDRGESRKKAQSTSGLSIARVTTPPEPRSIAMTNSTPKDCRALHAFFKYAYEVPHFSAKAQRSAKVGKDSRNARSCSIRTKLPFAGMNATPEGTQNTRNSGAAAVAAPAGIRYPAGMTAKASRAAKPFAPNDPREALYELRRSRLHLLRASYPTVAALARVLNMNPGYLRRLLQDERNEQRRNIGETVAREIEVRTGKPEFWLDNDTGRAPITRDIWPFPLVPREVWEQLSAAEKRAVQPAILALLLGMQAMRLPERGTG